MRGHYRRSAKRNTSVADSTLTRPLSNAGPVFGLTTGPGEVVVADAGQGVVRLRHLKTELVVALPGVTDVDVINPNSSGKALVADAGGNDLLIVDQSSND